MKPIFERREFLGVSLAVTATLLRAAEPSVNFPTDPRQRLAVSSYPFRAQIVSPRSRDKGNGQGGMTLPQFGEYIVSKLHVSGIEPWGVISNPSSRIIYKASVVLSSRLDCES